MEGRRRTGLLVLALVAVLTLAVSATSGRLGGQALPIPLERTPAVGDCLLAVSGSTTSAHPSAVADETVSPALLTSAPCTGSRYGEITGINALASSTVALSTSVADTCDQATARYVNGTAVGIAAPGRPGAWASTVRITTLTLRPSPRQLAAGQDWTACAAVQLDSTGMAVRYAGSFQDVTRSGRLAHLIGTCLDGTSLSVATPVACSRPHSLETFGFVYSDIQTQSAAALRSSCASLVDRLTAAQLSTASTLRVDVQAVGPGDGAAAGLVAHGNATCAVQATDRRQLTGTLLGLGARPIPWA